MSLFYETAICISPGIKIKSKKEHRGLPRDLHMQILEFFDEQREQDRLYPEAAIEGFSDRYQEDPKAASRQCTCRCTPVRDDEV